MMHALKALNRFARGSVADPDPLVGWRRNKRSPWPKPRYFLVSCPSSYQILATLLVSSCISLTCVYMHRCLQYYLCRQWLAGSSGCSLSGLDLQPVPLVLQYKSFEFITKKENTKDGLQFDLGNYKITFSLQGCVTSLIRHWRCACMGQSRRQNTPTFEVRRLIQ